MNDLKECFLSISTLIIDNCRLTPKTDVFDFISCITSAHRDIFVVFGGTV